MTAQADLRVSDQWLVVLYSFLIQAVGIGIAIYCFATFSLPWLDEFGASRRDIMLTTFWLLERPKKNRKKRDQVGR